MLPTPESVAVEALARMSLEQKVGQVCMFGFAGTTLTPENRALIEGLHLGGVTLFGRNIESARQVSELTLSLQRIADPVPLLIAMDQEGGAVVRVTEGATIFPGSMALGATDDVDLAHRVAVATATELVAMGVNMNLAPVVDVNTNPLNPVIGVRAFGANVERVARFGAATVHGLQSTGVSAVAKHFPGHGDSDVDSHRDLPVLPHTVDRLSMCEWVPFEAAIAAGVDGIMTAHIYLPRVEPEPNVPATLSRTILTDLLRTRLGYTGLILTDALDMGAIKNHRTAAEAAVQACLAGADLLLIAGITADDRARLADTPHALLRAVESGRISQQRLDHSVRRVLLMKARRGILPGALPRERARLDTAEHHALALQVARRAVTLLRDRAHQLPVHPDARVLVVTPDPPRRTNAEGLEDNPVSGGLLAAIQRYAPAASDTPDGPADVIIVAAHDLAGSPDQQTRVAALAASGVPVILVSLRGPYAAAAVPTIGTVLAVYGDRRVHLQAAAEALFGAFTPTGIQP